MTKPILDSRGYIVGWDITDDEAREVIRASGGTVADDEGDRESLIETANILADPATHGRHR